MSSKLRYPSEKDLENNRLLGIIEGASAKTIFNLTSGAFLVGLLKTMGASDAFCGYILAIPVLAAGAQVFSPIVLESLESRKRIIVIGSMLHRLLLVSLIATPFLPVSPDTRLIIATIIFLISNVANSFVNPAISNMYVSFVPQNIRGRYFGRRESYLLLVATFVTLIVGRILDNFTAAGKELNGHIVVYAFIFFFTLVNSLSYMLMKEVPLRHTNTRLKLSDVFTRPLKDRRFILYFIMLIIYNFGVQIANAYYSVYLKSDLNMSYTFINILNLLNAILYVFSASRWGRFADRRGWATTTMLTVGILGICHCTWFFCSEQSILLIPLLVMCHILGGIAWSGINVSLFNLQFDFTPDKNRTMYIGFSAAISGVLGYLAAMVGAQLVSRFGQNKILFLGAFFDIKQILFLTSGLLLLICSIYIFFFMKNTKTKKTKKANEEEDSSMP